DPRRAWTPQTHRVTQTTGSCRKTARSRRRTEVKDDLSGRIACPHTTGSSEPIPLDSKPTSILTRVKDPARPFRQASMRLWVAVLGGLLPGSVPVIEADPSSIWPPRRALRLTRRLWSPAPARLTDWPDQRLARVGVAHHRCAVRCLHPGRCQR